MVEQLVAYSSLQQLTVADEQTITTSHEPRAHAISSVTSLQPVWQLTSFGWVMVSAGKSTQLSRI